MSDAEGGGRYDAIVLGAGISGLVSASVLLNQGCSRVLVADEYAHLGGNHIDWSSGDYTFDIGSLIFQDDSPLLAHFPELLPRYVPIDPRWARLNPQGMVTAYPISLRDDLLAAGPVQLSLILGSVLYARLFQRKMANARDFARYWIGDRLLRRSGLEAYMRRFYGIEPERIDLQLARKRMQWISENASVASLLRKFLAPRPTGPGNRQLARPREGFQHLYSAAAEQLSQRGVGFRLGTKLEAITKEAGGFRLRCADGDISASRIVSTIPLPRAQELCGIPAAKLETVTLLALYFSFAGSERGFDASILYNFSHESAWKRLTVYSDFYGRAGGREYFAAEVIADHIGGDIAKAESDFRDHMAANGLFTGDLKLEGHQFLENAYPIYKNGAEEAAAEAVRSLQAFGIESLGRQGAFNYQPTARVSTIEAEAALRT
ncbi:FAD-dependent oxidoreductase [Bosea sp. BH3]|uniref:FAD-dependent oxidoreductase n=1 Tax=Bosea sp. BH3 TaxID=2871701 RepID=UPI0021CB46D1|nr:FAD-dependent oxidoreductase [Bosea sp. BH3]MCU4181120.1 FAD-dependent oxidoreductase [Bosea sp. BH3]